MVVDPGTAVLRSVIAMGTRAGRPTKPCGLPLPALAAGVGPVRAGDLVVVAGRRSVGKTSLAADLAYHAAAVERVPTVFVSLETAMSDLVTLMLARHGGLRLDRLGREGLDPRKLRGFMEAAGQLARAPFSIHDRPHVTLASLRTLLGRRPRGAPGLRLAIVDYVQLLDPGRRRESCEVTARRVSLALKRVARESGSVVVAISQLNRAPGRRQVPRASDLRSWTPLAAAADAVVLLHRVSYLRRGASKRLRILVAKRRAS